MARLGGGRPPRRPAEPFAGAGGEERRQTAIGERVMAWWRARVVAPVRRAWLAVARVRKGECGTILSLHQDVQKCGYHDVQVMWDMLSSEKEEAATPVTVKKRVVRRPFCCWPPAMARSSCAAMAQ